MFDPSDPQEMFWLQLVFHLCWSEKSDEKLEALDANDELELFENNKFEEEESFDGNQEPDPWFASVRDCFKT